MTTKNKKSVYLQAITIIDPAMGWIEMCTIPLARADLVSNQVELAWLTRFPLPSKVIVDHRHEFFAGFETMIQAGYDIQAKPITSTYTQANSI